MGWSVVRRAFFCGKKPEEMGGSHDSNPTSALTPTQDVRSKATQVGKAETARIFSGPFLRWRQDAR